MRREAESSVMTDLSEVELAEPRSLARWRPCAASCTPTATACSARCTTPTTPSRMRCCGRGARSDDVEGRPRTATVALPDRDQHLPRPHRPARPSRAARRPRPVQRPRGRRRRPADRRRLAQPVPGRALRAARVRRARVRRRPAAPARQPAGRAPAVRGAGLLRRRDRHLDGHDDRLGELRAAARAGDGRGEGAAPRRPPGRRRAGARGRRGVLRRPWSAATSTCCSRCSRRTSPGRCRRCRTGTAAWTPSPSSRRRSRSRAARGSTSRRARTVSRRSRPTCGAPGEDVHRAWSIDVLTFRGDRVAGVTAFIGPEHFEAFGLPLTHP